MQSQRTHTPPCLLTPQVRAETPKRLCELVNVEIAAATAP
jgi:hypothetical protein